MKSWWKEALLQIIPVMIGVYLGFVASNWGEQRKAHQQAEILISNLRSEMALNQEKILPLIEYHRMLRDSANRYAMEGGLKKKPAFFKGIAIEPLLSSAFVTGVQTGIVNELPIGTIQQLNQLYSYQDSYNEYGLIILESLINMDFSLEEDKLQRLVQFLAITMTDLAMYEQKLLEMYRDLDTSL
jgi:hypothetical protein